TTSIDFDAYAQPELNFDIALRMGEATITTQRDEVIDRDRICSLDLRAELNRKEVLIRRLNLRGNADLEHQGTAPSCASATTNRVDVGASSLRIKLDDEGVEAANGSLFLRAPLGVVQRIPDSTAFTGWTALSGEVAWNRNMRLPEFVGQVSGADVGLVGSADSASTIFSEAFYIDLALANDVIRIPHMEAKYAGGQAILQRVEIEPFAKRVPLSIAHIDTQGVNFPELMRYLDQTDHSWVDWDFGHTVIDNVRGTIAPFYIDGKVFAETDRFRVYDRGFDEPSRQTMVHVDNATVDGRFRAHSEALDFYQTEITFKNSRLPVDLVRIGFANRLAVKISEPATIDLEQISPIGALDLSGLATLTVDLEGAMDDPPLEATLDVSRLGIGGFQAGDIKAKSVHFQPLYVEFLEVEGVKERLEYKIPRLLLDFDSDASVAVHAGLVSENFYLKEFFEVFHFEDDPRLQNITGSGRVEASIHYLLGGQEDACKSGRLRLGGRSTFGDLQLMGESYSGARGNFELDWFDLDAGLTGASLRVPALSLEKGSGSIYGSIEMAPGGRLAGDFIGTRVPAARIDALHAFLGTTDGYITGTGSIDGTVDRLEVSSTIYVSPLQSGKSILGASALELRVEPTTRPVASSGQVSACGRPIPLQQSQAATDLSDGDFVINGHLFQRSVELTNLRLTQQTHPIISGKAKLNALNLGKLGPILPGAAELASLPTTELTGELMLQSLPIDQPIRAEGELQLQAATVDVRGTQIQLASQKAKIRAHQGEIHSSGLVFAVAAATDTDQTGLVDVKLNLSEKKGLASHLYLRPTSLNVIQGSLPGVIRAEGSLTAGVHLRGSFADPKISGEFNLKDGAFYFEDIPAPITELNLGGVLTEKGFFLKRSSQGLWGDGVFQLSGAAPYVARGRFGQARVHWSGKNILLPFDSDFQVAFSGELDLVIPIGNYGKQLPRLTGNLSLDSGYYRKPMAVSADLAQLTGRGKKSDVDTYIPELDIFALDIVVNTKRPFEVENALLTTAIDAPSPGIRLTGTDQRFGAVGTIIIPEGGRLQLRGNEFEIQQGTIRFSDGERLRPEIDLTALTEYRRNADSSTNLNSGDTSTDSGGGSNVPLAGNWRISLHAFGPPEDLQVEFASDPPLAQDDIFLLLAVGLTRAELDQARNSGVGQSVALEALGSLSGAESAVTKNVPIDEFRFGSTWSSRTGRSEPTVTIGKKLSKRLRASVTTGLSDASSVQSNLQYKATENMSLEGSYDNSQGTVSAFGGNLGGDIRWRIEFE
ncbi:MAG: translocation/assembly module TamB, partial [Polyangiaceae bacterium]|nr:translocation/assembly module TamB [Polyangiaceae bacterium]